MDGQNGSDSTSFTQLKRRLSTLRMKLRSPKPGDVFLGFKEVEALLTKLPEDLEIYRFLLDVVKETADLRGQVRAILLEAIRNGSRSAEKALSMIPSTIPDLLADADDAYYAGEHEQAAQLYRQVLRLDPESARAKEYLTKAMAEKSRGAEVSNGLPREAVQFFRRARSFIAAKDYVFAVKALGSAVEIAQSKGVKYPEAEELLNTVQNAQIAEEYKQHAISALKEKRWEDAIDAYKKALTLDPTNKAIQHEMQSLESLLVVVSDLQKMGILRVFAPIRKLQAVFGTARGTMNSENPLLISVEKQIRQILRIRFGAMATFILILLIYVLSLSEKFEFFEAHVTNTLPNYTSTILPTETLIPIVSIIATSASTAIPSVVPTNTPEPTATPVPRAYGKLLSAYFVPYDEPNKNQLDIYLHRNQYLIIINVRADHGAEWYECIWEIDGATGRGWILAEKIKIVQPPTATP